MTTNSFAEKDVQSFLENLAKENGFKEPLYEISLATKAGDNFVGRVTRTIIREKSSPSKELAVIVKTAPVSKPRRIAFRSSYVWRNEGNMYQVVLPALNKVLLTYGLSKSNIYPGTARCYGTKLQDDPEADDLDIVVMEDMGKQGYKMVDRSVGLDANTCIVILKELARLHGASLALRHLNPEEAKRAESSITETVFSRANPNIDQMKPIVESTGELTLDRYPPGTPEHTKLRKFLDNYVEELIFLCKPNETLSCVTHGDCWSNNVLFKFDKNGSVEKTCLLDFQLARIACPVIDIMYLIFSCTTKETRDAHYQTFLKTYHEELSSNLRKCGVNPQKVVPWTTFLEQVKIYGRFGLTTALLTISYMLAESSEAPQDMDEMFDNNVEVSEVFTSIKVKAVDRCKERLSDVLLDTIELGYL